MSKNLKIKIITVMVCMWLWNMIIYYEERVQPRSIRKQDPKANIRIRRDGSEEWRKLRNEVFHDLYCSYNFFRVIKSRNWNGQMRIEDSKNAFKVLIWKPIGKWQLKYGRRCEDNIRMDPEQIGIKSMNWIQFYEDRNQWRPLV